MHQLKRLFNQRTIPQALRITSVSQANGKIQGLCAAGRVSDAYLVLDEMKSVGIKPNTGTFRTLVSGYCGGGNVDLAFALVKRMPLLGVEPDAEVGSALVDGCCDAGRLDRAVEAMASMRRAGVVPSAEAYATLIFTCATQGNYDLALAALADMRKANLMLSGDTLSALVETCCDAEEFRIARRVLTLLAGSGAFPNDELITNTVAGFCEKSPARVGMGRIGAANIPNDAAPAASSTAANDVLPLREATAPDGKDLAPGPGRGSVMGAGDERIKSEKGASASSDVHASANEEYHRDGAVARASSGVHLSANEEDHGDGAGARASSGVHLSANEEDHGDGVHKGGPRGAAALVVALVRKSEGTWAPSSEIVEKIVRTFCVAGKPDEAEDFLTVLERKGVPRRLAWQELLVRSSLETGQLQGAVQALALSRKARIKLSDSIFREVINACCAAPNANLGRAALNERGLTGLPLDLDLYDALYEACLSKDLSDDALNVLLDVAAQTGEIEPIAEIVQESSHEIRSEQLQHHIELIKKTRSVNASTEDKKGGRDK